MYLTDKESGMPRIGESAPHVPEVHVEPTSQAPVPPRDPQASHESAPGHGATLATVAVLSPTGLYGGRVLVRSAGRPTGWHDSYALPRVPDEYVSTSEPGIFEDMQSGQRFVFHLRRPYAVVHDPATQNWRLTTPGNPLELGSALQRNALGDWILHREPAPSGSAGTADRSAMPPPASTAQLQATGAAEAVGRRQAPPEFTPEDRIANYLLKHPGTQLDRVPGNADVTHEQLERIASNVQSAVRAWHDLQSSRIQLRRSVIVQPFTEREKAYVRKWGSSLPTETLAGIMRKPKDMIDNYLHRLGRRMAPAPADGRRVRWRKWAQEEWLRAMDDDSAAGVRLPGVSFTREARAFSSQWNGRLSVRTIGILMTLPNEVLAAHMRAFRQGTAEASDAVPSEQAGPSGHGERERPR